MTPEKLTDNAVTVIIGETVRPGCEESFDSLQQTLNSAASHYPGFIAAEIERPTSGQPQWSVSYRFDSIPNLRAWLNSATRQERLAEVQGYCDGPATQRFLTGRAAVPDTLVTTVVTHRVAPGQVDDFLSWQERFRLAESKFPGYRGSEMFRPIDGEQNEWTMIYRYDTAADLDKWLTSRERKRLLKEGKNFGEFRLRTIDSSFGNWFSYDDIDGQARTPSDLKTVIAVWVGLYPTVMLLALATAPAKQPVWLDRLFSNLFGSFVMTFITMPFYVNPMLRRWLYPAPDAPKRATNIRAALVIAVVTVLWAVFFWLVTTVFWKPF